MEPASIAIALMLATAPSSASNVQGREPPIRCRPAPYYVSERTGKQIPRVLLDTPKGRSITVLAFTLMVTSCTATEKVVLEVGR